MKHTEGEKVLEKDRLMLKALLERIRQRCSRRYARSSYFFPYNHSVDSFTTNRLRELAEEAITRQNTRSFQHLHLNPFFSFKCARCYEQERVTLHARAAWNFDSDRFSFLE